MSISSASVCSISSIVPSRMSKSTSRRDSCASGQSQGTIEDRRFAFEERLFASKVYMRNTKILMINELSKARTGFKRRNTATATDHSVTDLTTIRSKPDADSLLATHHDKVPPCEPEADSLLATDHDETPLYELEANSLLATHHDKAPPCEPEADSLPATSHDASIRSESTVDSLSATSHDIWTFTPEVSPRPISLTALSQASFSPTSLARNILTTLVASCLAYSMTFTGYPRDVRTNFLRHLRTARRHNKTAGLKCPQPECLTKPPMRSDNLGPHLRRMHRMPLAERQVVIDKCRLSARRANVDGSLQRALRRAVNV